MRSRVVPAALAAISIANAKRIARTDHVNEVN